MSIKRILPAVVLSLALLIPALSLADVAWEPENDFYWAHAQQCVYENRAYLARTDVSFCDEPDGKPVFELKSGEQVFIYYTYTDKNGKLWGVSERNVENKGWSSGWAALDELERKYDSISFYEEHASELVYPKEGEYALSSISLPAGTQFVAWTYPNSGEIICTMESEEDYLPEFSALYTDELGRRWAVCDYYYGVKGFWVFLDDPKSENVPLSQKVTPVPAAETPAPTAAAGESPVPTTASAQPRSLIARLLLPILLVGGVFLVTVIVLLIVFLPRRKVK